LLKGGSYAWLDDVAPLAIATHDGVVCWPGDLVVTLAFLMSSLEEEFVMVLCMICAAFLILVGLGANS